MSLPDLDEMDKVGQDIHFNMSADTDSGRSIVVKTADREPEVRIFDKVEEQTVEQDIEKGVVEEEGEEEKTEYIDPFLKWASKGMWHHLLYTLCPVEISEWHELSIPVKVIQIIQAPIFLLFNLTIPVVYEDLEPAPSPVGENEVRLFGNEGGDGNDGSMAVTPGDEEGDIEVKVNADGSNNRSSRVATEANDETSAYMDLSHVDIEDLHGWCRLLNCFQCLITPMLWVLLITGKLGILKSS